MGLEGAVAGIWVRVQWLGRRDGEGATAESAFGNIPLIFKNRSVVDPTLHLRENKQYMIVSFKPCAHSH